MAHQTDYNWLILGWDKDEVKIYQLRMPKEHHNSKRDALVHFHALCKQYEWKPFRKIDVYHLAGDDELTNITTLTVSQ